MPVALQFGDIVDIRSARDINGGRKLKIAVCVETNEYWFFYINSKHYSFAADSTIEIRPEYLDRITHKSYLDMHSVKTADIAEIESINREQIYRFNDSALYQTMMYKIQSSRLLSKEQKDKIMACYNQANATK